MITKPSKRTTANLFIELAIAVLVLVAMAEPAFAQAAGGAGMTLWHWFLTNIFQVIAIIGLAVAGILLFAGDHPARAILLWVVGGLLIGYAEQITNLIIGGGAGL